jgi:DNA-binding transcriptional LysR family regulator
MNWGDLRFVAAVARHGSLLKASAELKVRHTTVGRRIDAAERELKTRLFARSTTGLVLTEEGGRLLQSLQQVEEAVNALERRASAEHHQLEGVVRVTAPETFGASWLAPRLAAFSRQHPGLRIELDPSGAVRDLSRREAEVAVRFFRSKQQGLVVRRAAEVAHGLYASKSYLARSPLKNARELHSRPLLSVPAGSVEAAWFTHLARGAAPFFTSTLTLGLVEAARVGLGIAVLPRYLGDAADDLEHLPMPGEPRETLWLTVHKDLRATPRVRAVLDFLVGELERDRGALLGR